MEQPEYTQTELLHTSRLLSGLFEEEKQAVAAFEEDGSYCFHFLRGRVTSSVEPLIHEVME